MENAVKIFGEKVNRTEEFLNNGKKLIEAGLSEEERRLESLFQKYTERTEKLKELEKNRALAVKERENAERASNTTRANQFGEVIAGIDDEIEALTDAKGRVSDLEAEVETLVFAAKRVTFDPQDEALTAVLDLRDAIQEAGDNLGDLSNADLSSLERHMRSAMDRVEGLTPSGGMSVAEQEARAEYGRSRIAGEGLVGDATKRERERALQEEIRQRERPEAIRASFSEKLQNQTQLAQVGEGAVSMSAAEQTRIRTETALMQEAKRRGIDLNEKLIGSELTYAQAIEQAANAQAEFVSSQEIARESAEKFAVVQNTLQRGIVESIVHGKSFSDVLSGLGLKMTEFALEAALFGNNGLFGGPLFGAASGGIFGGAILPGILHDGGIVGKDGYNHNRVLPASAWDTALRYHNGGIAGLHANEVPAILERGEIVVPNKNIARGQSREEGAIAVDISVHPSGEFDARVERIAGPVSARAIGQNNRMLQEARRR